MNGLCELHDGDFLVKSSNPVIFFEIIMLSVLKLIFKVDFEFSRDISAVTISQLELHDGDFLVKWSV